ncbi:MAG: OmpA family protein [Pseudomonadota bacterium]
MNRKFGLLITLAMALVLSACSSTKKDQGVTDVAPVVDTNAYGTGLSVAELEALGIFGNPLDYTVLYFAYNSSAMDQKSDVIARAHAREMASRGGVSVELHGHADERGSRGYNLALSERRGNSVASVMSSEGTGGSELKVVAHGEEDPADEGHNEAAWEKNRRVEINY